MPMLGVMCRYVCKLYVQVQLYTRLLPLYTEMKVRQTLKLSKRELKHTGKGPLLLPSNKW